MHFIVSVIAEMAAEIISSTMGILFYAFLFKLIFHRKPKKTKEIQANEHVYYPVRFYVPFAKLLCEYIAFMTIMVSLQLWIREYWAGGRDFAIVCMGYGLVTLFVPFEKKVNRVIISAKGITLECYAGACFCYTPDQYEGCEGKYLCFQDPGGKRKREKLHFLCLEDRDAVIQDMDMLKKLGTLTGATAMTTQEAWRKANQQFREEKQKLYADTKRYEAYLKEEASKRLTASQKQDLIRKIQTGDKMNAIKQCREWTGLGLKEAKDMVEQYQKCLMDKEESDYMSPIVTAPENNTDRLKSDAEIRELDKKYSDESEKWKKLYENPAQYDAFLRQAGKQISENRRREIVQMAQNGEMVKAIKLFRDTTGLSLKVSHDLVIAYKTYLAAEEKRAETPENKRGFSWKWLISGREQEFSEQKSLESTMDQLLSDLSMRREDSIALIPPAPLLGIVCVRACLDPQGITYRTEVEYLEHDAQGNPKILFKNGLMSWDVRDVFVAFRHSAKVQTDGWQRAKH